MSNILDALERLKTFCNSKNGYPYNQYSQSLIMINNDLYIIENTLKALEIIKNKELNIYFVKRLSLEDFNFQCRYDQQLTQEDFDLLKEIL